MQELASGMRNVLPFLIRRMHKSEKIKDTLHSSAMYYQNFIIIHECSKKVIKDEK